MSFAQITCSERYHIFMKRGLRVRVKPRLAITIFWRNVQLSIVQNQLKTHYFAFATSAADRFWMLITNIIFTSMLLHDIRC